jgi:predicted CXXCH cytochrome family protein
MATQRSTAQSFHHPDEACASCHQAIYQQYEKTSMARGSGVATDGFLPGEFTHQPSGITYQVYLKDGQAWMSYNRPGNSAPLQGARQLAYYIGSGHRGRTYLFETENLWFEAPINYYGKKQLWDMAPGYTSAQTMPLTLPVDSNCLHCHASEVGTAVDGVRNKYLAQPFAAGGIGCAACHGDPSSHLAAEATHQGVGIITNPSKLEPAQRDSTCLQCHLEGDAAIYKSGRSLVSYKPGENLSDSVVYFVNTSRPNFGNRASSQYEALLRSACKRASGDKLLTCTSCHDPHSSPAPEQRVAFYRTRCLACHTGVEISTKHHPEQQDCAVCHMPTRDTQDISHEQLTDHDIERVPRTVRAPLQLRDLGETGAGKPAELVVVGTARYSDRELGLAYAQLARKGDRHSGEKSISLLSIAEQAGRADAEVHAQLGFLLQLSGNREAAATEYQSALHLDPLDIVSMSNLAVLDASAGRGEEALRLLQQAVTSDPSQTTAGMNLAFMECRLGLKAEAARTLQKMSRFNPDDPILRTFRETGTYGGSKCPLNPKVE